MRMAIESVGGTQAVDRALSILQWFDERTPELGVAEVAARLDEEIKKALQSFHVEESDSLVS